MSAWRPGRLAMGTAWGIAVYGSRMVAQAVYFVILARALQQAEFGTFTGTWVLAGLGSSMASMGFQVLAMKTAALHPERAVASIGKGLRAVALTAPVMLLAFVAAGRWWFDAPMPLQDLVLLGIGEIAITPVLALIASWHQGNERIGHSQAVMASVWVARLLVLAVLALTTRLTLSEAVVAHLATTAAIAAAWLVRLRLQIGALPRTGLPPRQEWLEGASFCASTVALIAYTEFNQTLTMTLVGASAAATLAAGYKVVSVFSAPISVLCQAQAPRLLRASANAHGRWRTPLVAIAAVAVACTASAWLAAHFVALIFGPDYESAIGVAKALAVLPFVTGIRMASVYVLAASASQMTRLAIELACMVGGVSVNWLLIRHHGLHGAVVGALLVESATALALAAAAWRRLRTRH